MTVPVQIPVTASVANGVTTVFPYGFMIADEADLAVTVDGVLQASGYTVSGVGNPSGGDVTFDVAPANGAKIVRFLDPVLWREENYTQFGDWMAEIVNLDFDRVWLALQAHQQDILRSLKLPVDTTTDQVLDEDATARADKGMKFDGDGNLILTLYDPDEIQTEAAASAAAAAASAAAAAASQVAAASDASDADTARLAAVAAQSAAETAQAAAETAEANAETAEANAEAAAIAQGMPFVFDTTTAMADPGAGKVRLNHATPASATAIALDDTDAETRDLSAYISTWDDSTNTNKGALVLTKSGGAAFAIYAVTGLTDNAGWTELAVTYVTGSGVISNADRVYLHFARTGDKGADGAGSGDFMADGSVPMTGALVFEGSTADAFETSLTVVDPTADNTIALPNKSGTVALTSDVGGSFKNKIIGGDFTTNPWQRGTTFTGIGTGTYGPDRFRTAGNVTGAVVDFKKTADAPTAAEAGIFTQHCLHLDVTTADAAVAATDLYEFMHVVEGYNAASFGFGQAGTRSLTLSFWVKSTKTGTFCVNFSNSAGNRFYVAEYSVSVADTWEKKTITLTADTTGTWLYDTGGGLYLRWVLMAGSNFNAATAGAWSASTQRATAGQVNALDNAANDFKIALVQLESGSAATTFEALPYQQVLALCQRYYYRIFPNVNAAQLVPSAYSFSTTVAHGTVTFPVTMRTAPTAVDQSGTAADYRVLHGATTTACSAVPVFNQANVYMAKTDFTVAAGLTVGQAGNIIAAAASSAGYLGWSAEL